MPKKKDNNGHRILLEYEIRFRISLREDKKTLVLVEGINDPALGAKLCQAVLNTLKEQPPFKNDTDT